MRAFQITLNGVDYSTAFNKWGVRWSPVKVTGPNEGISQGGHVIIDLLRVKDLLTLQGNDVEQRVYSALQAVCAEGSVTAVFTHPATGKTVNETMIPTLSEAAQKPMPGGKVYLSGWTLTLEER